MTLLIREHSSSSYAPRTWANATEADLTIAIAIDYNTAGERLTKKAATYHGEEHFLKLDPLGDNLELARILYKHMKRYDFKSLNIAGNGIYTWAKQGITQRVINTLVYTVIKQVHEHWPIQMIVSGGQTGTDIAGGYAGWKLGIDTVLTLPKGFLQRHEDGVDRGHTMEEIWEQVTGTRPAVTGSML